MAGNYLSEEELTSTRLYESSVGNKQIPGNAPPIRSITATTGDQIDVYLVNNKPVIAIISTEGMSIADKCELAGNIVAVALAEGAYEEIQNIPHFHINTNDIQLEHAIITYIVGLGYTSELTNLINVRNNKKHSAERSKTELYDQIYSKLHNKINAIINPQNINFITDFIIKFFKGHNNNAKLKSFLESLLIKYDFSFDSTYANSITRTMSKFNKKQSRLGLSGNSLNNILTHGIMPINVDPKQATHQAITAAWQEKISTTPPAPPANLSNITKND